MSYRDAKRLERAIDSARNEARTEIPDENRAWLAQIMTVWASGYLESVCRNELSAYASRKGGHPHVVNFVVKYINNFRNPNMGKILDLIRRFDSDLATQLEAHVDDRIQESVNSIVGLRNLVAHGRQSTVTIARISEHFDNARKFARKLKEVLGA